MPRSHDDLRNGFELGAFRILPDRGLVRRGGHDAHIEPLVMDVLLMLAKNHGAVVSKDDLVDTVWHGRATTDEVIAAKISLLRKALGDDPKDPAYVETVQKRGYRLKASVSLRQGPEQPAHAARRWAGLALVSAAIAVAAFVTHKFWPDSDEVSSVAVLQFRNLSEDRERFQYVVDGFAEELVVTLDQVPGLRFARGTGTGEGQSLEEIAKRLNVDAVITGSLRTDGSKLRVTAQLILSNGFQIWADRFDAAAGDVFGIQERVASEVRDRIVKDDETELRAVSRPANPEAYDTYMRGLFFLARRDPASLRRALDLFGETVQLDPGFGPAYLRRAIALLLSARYDPGNEDSIFDAALEIAANGAQADAGIREPLQLIHGFVNHERRDWAAAADAYERAMQAHTVYPTAVSWYSLFLGDLGFSDRALSQAIVARDLEPAAPALNSRVAIAYLWRGDMDNAARYFDVANSMEVGVPDHYFVYAVYLLRSGRIVEARQAVAKAIELAQQRSDWIEPLFAGIADPHSPSHVQTALQIIDLAAESDNVPVYFPLMLWSFFGESGRMMAFAHERVDSGAPFKNLELIYQDEFAAFRQEPGFSSLLEKLGLAQYWETVGCRWQDDRLHCDRQ